MMLARGDVVLVPFPFTDLTQQKARPAIVLSSREFNQQSPDVILAAVSSQVPDSPSDLELVLRYGDPGFAKTGLRVSSVVKTAKRITLQQALVYRTLGRLHKKTLVQIDDRLIRALGLNSLSIEIAARRKAESELETLKAQITGVQAVLGTSEMGETSRPDTGQPRSN